MPDTFLNYAGMGFGWLGAHIACKLAPAAAASFPLGLLAGSRKDTADDGLPRYRRASTGRSKWVTMNKAWKIPG
ncbi:MAG: hypothetical protein OEY56_06550 [Cyclobacteriaceae bacterium]|nr:hypothetical protein [Cyclobacteriaceae bacterium]